MLLDRAADPHSQFGSIDHICACTFGDPPLLSDLIGSGGGALDGHKAGPIVYLHVILAADLPLLVAAVVV
jgi:hypothetical protein